MGLGSCRRCPGHVYERWLGVGASLDEIEASGLSIHDQRIVGGRGNDLLTGVVNDDSFGSPWVANACCPTAPRLEHSKGQLSAFEVHMQLRSPANEDGTRHAPVVRHGDPLTFAWHADCVGTYDDPAAATPTFTLGALDDTSCTLSVEVTDGRGGWTTGELTIETGPGPEVETEGE